MSHYKIDTLAVENRTLLWYHLIETCGVWEHVIFFKLNIIGKIIENIGQKKENVGVCYFLDRRHDSMEAMNLPLYPQCTST